MFVDAVHYPISQFQRSPPGMAIHPRCLAGVHTPEKGT